MIFLFCLFILSLAGIIGLTNIKKDDSDKTRK